MSALGTEQISDGETRVELVPARGAIVTSFSVGERQLLYLDEATLRDPEKNVRGGIPVLFPSPGKLRDDRWARGGRTGSLPQHGFARRRAFRILERDARSIQLVLDHEPDAGWPYACSLELRYVVGPGALRIETVVRNRSAEPMPFGLGLHPYFLVDQADKGRVRIPTSATQAFDNVHKQLVPVSPATLDLRQAEVDLHLVDHGASEARLIGLPEGRELRIAASPELQRWVIWTLADRDFVCLEPWTCSADALNGEAPLLELPPGETRELFVEISAPA